MCRIIIRNDLLRETQAGIIHAMPRKHKPRKESAAAFINLNAGRMDPAELKNRFAERDRRLAADTRTETEKWLGDPPVARSALAHHGTAKRSSSSYSWSRLSSSERKHFHSIAHTCGLRGGHGVW